MLQYHPMPNVLMYLRVSTRPPKDTDKNKTKMEEYKKKVQDTENQGLQLREYAKRKGWTIIQEYVDKMTGKRADRPQLEKLMNDAIAGKGDLVLTWALDRFTREGIAETFIYIKRLKDAGVDFWSYTEPQFRTTGPSGSLLIALAAWFAEQERIRTSERTKAGLEKARKMGKTLGRPRIIMDRLKVKELHDAGASMGQIAKTLDLSKTTVARTLHALMTDEEVVKEYREKWPRIIQVDDEEIVGL